LYGIQTQDFLEEAIATIETLGQCPPISHYPNNSDDDDNDDTKVHLMMACGIMGPISRRSFHQRRRKEVIIVDGRRKHVIFTLTGNAGTTGIARQTE
jgi:hypothetical protein